MLGTREREVNLREERANEYRALRSDNYNEYSFRGYED